MTVKKKAVAVVVLSRSPAAIPCATAAIGRGPCRATATAPRRPAARLRGGAPLLDADGKCGTGGLLSFSHFPRRLLRLCLSQSKGCQGMLLGVLVAVGAIVLLKVVSDIWTDWGKRGPFRWPLVYCLPEFLANIHRKNEWYEEQLAKYGTHFYFRVPFLRAWFVTEPADVQHFLATNFGNYIKGDSFGEPMYDLIGHGIFAVDGEKWRIQRKIASREFSVSKFRNLQLHAFVEHAEKVVEIVRKHARKGEAFDLQDVFYRFTMDSMVKIAFGQSVDCLGSEHIPFMSAFDEATRLTMIRWFDPLWKIKRFLNVGSERRMAAAVATVNEFIYGCLDKEEQKSDPEDGDYLLARFVNTRDDNGNSFSRPFLRDICASFILAGRDTTANCLSWLFYELCMNPRVEQKLVDELLSVPEDSRVQFDELHTRSLPYLQATISEALRLHPPVPEDGKECVVRDRLPCGVMVDPGEHVAFNPWVQGRRADLWPNPTEFKPERWLKDGECIRESPFKFPVFQAGPRICLGLDMAQLEVKALVATLLPHFTFRLASDAPVTYDITLTLPVKNGLHVVATERKRQ
eukprot:m.175061 g.175061  ORF g.175061 m.175061 type:complete len:574 (-) comp17340_c0_seq1:1920-3641(-)